jgi:hypothetical protein
MMRLLAVVLTLLQTTLSVRTVLVARPVTVTDGRGRRVLGLTRDDFRVYDGGRPQGPRRRGTPITLGLIVDHSYSMRDNPRRHGGANGVSL